MNRKEYIAGLDIGTTKTCCVLADADPDTDGVDIIGVGLRRPMACARAWSSILMSTTEAIRNVVDKAQKQAGNVQISNVVVGVTGEHISSLNSRGVIAITSSDKEVTERRCGSRCRGVKVIVLPPEREIIHSIPRGFTVDGQDGIKDPWACPAAGSKSRLISSPDRARSSTTWSSASSGRTWRSRITVLEPIATSASAVLDAEKDLGVCADRHWRGTTDVAVFTNGEIFYTAVLPIGGTT